MRGMDRSIASALARAFRRNISVVAGSVLIVAVGAANSGAQTLSDPNPRTNAFPPKATAKSLSDKHAKTCKAYGAGFVQIAGTDACVKIGGYVTVEGGR
jgi:hypothetical protein